MCVIFKFKYFKITKSYLLKYLTIWLFILNKYDTKCSLQHRTALECVTRRKCSRKYHEMKLNFNDGLDPHASLISMGATFPHRSLVEWIMWFKQFDVVTDAIDMLVMGEIDVVVKRGREEGWWGGLMDGRMDGWRKEGEKEPV